MLLDHAPLLQLRDKCLCIALEARQLRTVHDSRKVVSSAVKHYGWVAKVLLCDEVPGLFKTSVSVRTTSRVS